MKKKGIHFDLKKYYGRALSVTPGNVYTYILSGWNMTVTHTSSDDRCIQ